MQSARVLDTLTPGAATQRACAVLIALLIVFLVVLETGTRTLLHRISRIEARVRQERLELASPVSFGKPLVLVAGNSLLDAGLNMDRVRDALSNRFQVRRFVVEQTSYHDWRYGLRYLYSSGVRPKVVVLMLSPDQLATSASRGEYSAFHLTAHSDIVSLCRDLNMHPTSAANMVVANFSMFYASRGEIRKVILGRLIPGMSTLARQLQPPPAHRMPEDQLREIANERLSILAREASQYGVRLMLALPPSHNIHGYRVVEQAARESGVQPLFPFNAADFQAADFSDGYHANAQGAARYTGFFLSDLRRLLQMWQ